jgi:hypothetical protein
MSGLRPQEKNSSPNMSEQLTLMTVHYEIRRHILGFVFEDAEVIVPGSTVAQNNLLVNQTTHNAVSIFLTSKQLHQEAKPILAWSIKLIPLCGTSQKLPQQFKDYYIPKIRSLELEQCWPHFPNFSNFVSLERLRLLQSCGRMEVSLTGQRLLHFLEAQRVEVRKGFW